MATVTKILVSDIPSLETLAISSAFAFIFLLGLNIKNGTIKQLQKYKVRDYAIMAGLGFIGLFLYSGLYYYGLTQLSSQEACIVNYLWPMMLVLFSMIILKEKMTFVKASAMLSSFAGVVILCVGSGTSVEGNAVFGIGSCLIAAACYGLFSVLNKKADYDQNIAMMVMWLVVTVCSAVIGRLFEEWKPITGNQWLGMLWLGIVTDAIAYLMWALALNGDKNTAKIANLAYLTPFLSLIISAVVLKEQIEFRAVIAFAFIIGGILLQTFYEQIQKKRKMLLFLMTIAMVAIGCGSTDSKDVKEEIVIVDFEKEENEITEVLEVSEPEQVNTLFDKMKDYRFFFASGAGGWSTWLMVQEDGTFSGEYSDSEMGSIGEDYPYGSYYYCEFKGVFSEPVMINDYTYSVKVQDISTTQTPDTEEIIEGIRYCYSKPFGIDGAEELLIYLPGAPISELPEEYMNWVRSAIMDPETEELPFYGLYNEIEQNGFSSYEIIAQ